MHHPRNLLKDAEALGWLPQNILPVSISDIWISKDAQVSIGRQLQYLCTVYELPYPALRQKMGRRLYWHKETDRLGLILELETTAIRSMDLQIPKTHWGFKHTGRVH